MPEHLTAAGGTVVLAAGKTNNFLLPNGTFIAELIAFLMVLFLLKKYVVPKVSESVSARQELIRSQIEDTRQAKQALDEAQAQVQAALAETRTDAARIREEAREQGRQIIEEMRVEAQKEAGRIAERERARLQNERQAIVAQLRTEVGQIAVELASRVVGESLADEARQRRTVDRFLEELESGGHDSAAADPGDADVAHQPAGAS